MPKDDVIAKPATLWPVAFPAEGEVDLPEREDVDTWEKAPFAVLIAAVDVAALAVHEARPRARESGRPIRACLAPGTVSLIAALEFYGFVDIEE